MITHIAGHCPPIHALFSCFAVSPAISPEHEVLLPTVPREERHSNPQERINWFSNARLCPCVCQVVTMCNIYSIPLSSLFSNVERKRKKQTKFNYIMPASTFKMTLLRTTGCVYWARTVLEIGTLHFAAVLCYLLSGKASTKYSGKARLGSCERGVLTSETVRTTISRIGAILAEVLCRRAVVPWAT